MAHGIPMGPWKFHGPQENAIGDAGFWGAAAPPKNASGAGALLRAEF
eukprot:CAMPEP_0183570116 /NCGR_PEP_ID=MMETSP0371-20130417/122149_1 /TAXON_ID=268820 /ORGANISM="Peridinium aciculiferum, Strain PAER-2" /LENGTH=46 /DNA_ID= /DNA_START= /DNA_END= /DNA_ORIENTATION=